jgi:hypothetical protein
MRLLLAALLIVLPSVADAQTATSDGSRRGRSQPPPPPSNSLPLPPIGLPLADITPTLAPLGIAPGPTETKSVPDRGPSRPPRQRGPHHRGRSGPNVVYVVPAYGWGLPSMLPAPAPAPAAATEATGTLWLDIEPRGTGEVYIDGYLAGTTLDVRGSMTLDAGAHRVEVRADGYQPVGVDVRIEAGGAVTLRRTLQPLSAAPEPQAAALPADAPVQPAPAPIARKPVYYIPGCYLGDVPPKDAGLPPTCDPSKTVVVKP